MQFFLGKLEGKRDVSINLNPVASKIKCNIYKRKKLWNKKVKESLMKFIEANKIYVF